MLPKKGNGSYQETNVGNGRTTTCRVHTTSATSLHATFITLNDVIGLRPGMFHIRNTLEIITQKVML